MRYRKDGSCRYVTCCMNASTWAEYSKPQTLISFLNTQKWKRENLLQTPGSRNFLGCAETKTEEGEKKNCTRKGKATVNFSARQSKISWIARQRKQRRYVDLYWRMDFFFSLFFTPWSPVSSSFLSCDVVISSCVFTMMWQPEKDLSRWVHLFCIFITRNTPISSPG